MTDLSRDFRYGLRMLKKNPWASGAAILALALGIGAGTAIFSVADALLLKPLPFPRAGRLMEVEQETKGAYDTTFGIAKYLMLRQGARGFTAMTAYEALGHGYNLVGDGPPQRIPGCRATWELFPVLGVVPRLGRGFTAEEDKPGGPPVVVLSDRFWRRQLGGDPAAVGRQVVLDGQAYTVVGVMPGDFRYPLSAELWTPLQLNPGSQDQARLLYVTGRLADGVTPEAARDGLESANRRYLEQQGWQDSEERMSVRPLQVFLHGDLQPALLVLLAAVGAVLLVASANVAGLQLARLVSRQREIAIRATLGAGTGRIVRQLLAESTLLALAGGALGVVLCLAVLGSLPALLPQELAARMPQVGVDGRVLGFALAVSLASGLLAGIAPALQARRVDLNDTVKEGSTGSGAGGGLRGGRVRYGLVVAEIALALVLLTSAGLLVRSFSRLAGTDPGFRPEGALTLKIPLPPARYIAPAALERVQQELLPSIETVPGVRSAGASTNLPFEPGAEMTFIIDGRYDGGDAGKGVSQYRAVSRHFFDAMRIPVLRGRGFTPADAAGAPGVMVLNETAARLFFPGENPLGQHILIGMPDMPDQADPRPRLVVGVARDVREVGMDKKPPPIFYVPLGQVPKSLNRLLLPLLPLNLVVRTDVPPASLARQVQEKIWAFDRDLPVTDVQELDALVARAVGAPRFRTQLLAGLAGLAVLLAAVGLYGLLAHLVGMRRREIGIRAALGGAPREIRRQVLVQGMMPVFLGVGVGLVGAVFATRLLAGFLYGVGTGDPGTFAGAALFMVAVALFAICLPAWRASRTDPAEALRHG
jgi:predicted permease